MEQEGNFEKYISQVLGLSCERKENVRLSLPLFLKGRFTFRLFSIESKDFLLLSPLKGLGMATTVVCSSAESIRKQTGYQTIIEIESVDAEIRRTLISKRESFVVPGKQLYVPQLGMLFQERGLNGKERENFCLSPAAQRMILFHLQAQSLNGLSLNSISELLGYPGKTITKIVKELKDKELCLLRTQDARSKSVHFTDEGKNLWEKARQFMQSPIKAVRYVDDINSISDIETSHSGDEALAHYTFIADNGNKSRSIYWRSEQIKQVELREHEGAIQVELWKYPPIIIDGSKYVDPLSLALCFKDENDERVDAELQKLVDKALRQW